MTLDPFIARKAAKFLELTSRSNFDPLLLNRLDHEELLRCAEHLRYEAMLLENKSKPSHLE